MIAQMTYILSNSEKIILLSTYGPTMGCTFFVSRKSKKLKFKLGFLIIFQTLVAVVYAEKISLLLKEFFPMYWPLKYFNLDHLLQEFTFLRTFTALSCTSVAIAGLFFLPLFNFHQDIVLFKQIFPNNFGKIVEIVFRISLPLQTLFAVSLVSSLFYCIISIKFQMLTLIHYIIAVKNIKFKNVGYQKLIKQKLRVIVTRHSSLTMYKTRV